MSSSFGNNLRISIFGESHGKAIGVSAEGFPAGETVDMEELFAFMKRRAPGNGRLVTQRKETDEPIFLSGLLSDRLTGFPLTAIIENKDTRSGDYSGFEERPRPGHADYTAQLRYGGHADMRGGGHFSGRLTAPLCIAGGIAKQILSRRGIEVGAHLYSVRGIKDTAYDSVGLTAEKLLAAGQKPFPVNEDSAGESMTAEIEKARAEMDSVGGIVECAVLNVPAGLGDPMFDGLENQLARVLFGIPAVKGVEFGAGFAAAESRGSENNDPFAVDDGRVVTTTNCHGGALGGITTGMPVLFRVAFKPTPSIGRPQRTVNLRTMEEETLEIKGRHDPCIALRAVPCVEAAAALVVLDMLLK